MRSSENQGLFKAFYGSSNRAFQINCFEWLSYLFPDLRDAVHLGEIDREGIDLYELKDDSNYKKVYQCKGFEKAFNKSQLKQCITSINSFIKSKSITEEYYLIINNEVNAEFENILINELKKIVNIGSAKEAYLLTPAKFTDYYNAALNKIILQEINDSNERFYESFTTIMEQRFYLKSVPFNIQDKESKEPLTFLSKKIIHTNNLPDITNSNCNFFVISEFGFGKTSLLLQLYHKFIDNGYTPIYIPASALGDKAFDSAISFKKEILKVVSQLDLEDDNKFLKYAAQAITDLLQSTPNVVILLDGLDEHITLYKKDSLRILFQSVNNYGSPCIFSLRHSFWEDRFENFQFAKDFTKTDVTKLFLTEWKEEEIIKYLDSVIKLNKRGKKNKSDHIRELRDLISMGNYHYYYGDIPKRPLFLEMIVRDVLNSSIQQRNIAELYLNYFKEKFRRDLHGQLKRIAPQRELPDKSLDAIIVALLEIHDHAAGSCIKKSAFTGESLLIENNIHERDIRFRLKQYGFPEDITKFLLLSVLTPISKRGNQNMKLKFVHKSFMEFFIARIILKEILNDFQFLQWLSYDNDFPDSILNFLKALVKTEIKERGEQTVKTMIDRNYSDPRSYPVIKYINKYLFDR
jgi:hypothetical protein